MSRHRRRMHRRRRKRDAQHRAVKIDAVLFALQRVNWRLTGIYHRIRRMDAKITDLAQVTWHAENSE